MTTTTEATWEAPGPGSWICDRSHTSASPTPLYRRIITEHTAPTYREVFERFGGAIATIDMQFVNGDMYRRLVPLIGADHDKGKMPPRPLLWLVSRLHPAMRRRNRTATRVMDTRGFLADIDHWTTTERFEWIDANRALQDVDVAALDDATLAAHLGDLDDQLVRGWHRHHELHANDLGPIGDLLAHAQRWGLDPTATMGLLEGGSPATAAAAEHGRTMADAVRQGGVDPATVTTLEAIRAVPEGAAALDDYLGLFGWRLVSDYDIEGLTLHELPDAVCAIVRRAAAVSQSDADSGDGGHGDTEAAIEGREGGSDLAQREAELRAQADDPALFDELIDSARRAYGLRDDNGPLTWAWPAGLTRRAYLEAGRRLAASGRVDDPTHVFELDIPELAALLEGADAPTSSEIVARAEHRAWEATVRGPDVLGAPPVEPDTSALPSGLRRLMDVILAATTMLEPERRSEPTALSGLGIGAAPYTGTARVASDPAQAVAEMQPGDVLVAAWTAPSFNAVLSIAGGVVVQEGGLLCHAAVMARELGIPAIIGCNQAMTELHSGDQVQVDPVAGEVRVLARAG
jgi:pyruvate,water dikinase